MITLTALMAVSLAAGPADAAKLTVQQQDTALPLCRDAEAGERCRTRGGDIRVRPSGMRPVRPGAPVDLTNQPGPSNMESEFSDEDFCDNAPPPSEREPDEWTGCPTEGERTDTSDGDGEPSNREGSMTIEEGPQPN